jgi:hypothetical protein
VRHSFTVEITALTFPKRSKSSLKIWRMPLGTIGTKRLTCQANPLGKIAKHLVRKQALMAKFKNCKEMRSLIGNPFLRVQCGGRGLGCRAAAVKISLAQRELSM